MSEEEKERIAWLEATQNAIKEDIAAIKRDTSELKKELHVHIESDHQIQQQILINQAENRTKLKVWGGIAVLSIPLLVKLLDVVMK